MPRHSLRALGTLLTARSALVAALAVTASAPAALAQGAAPTSHTVKTGDTLWGLAQAYLGDPFLWPDIYRMNTDVVEDPHWIYPGEVLRLAAGPEVRAVPATDTPLPADTAVAATGDAVPVRNASVEDTRALRPLFPRRSSSQSLRESVREVGRSAYRPLRRSEFHASGFLTEGRPMVYGELVGTVTPPQIRTLTRSSSALLFSEVAVQPPAEGAYQPGDSLLVAQILRAPADEYGAIVAPTGLIRVTRIENGHAIAEVVAMYGAIRNGQQVLPAEQFEDPGAKHPVPVENGIEAQVAGWPGRHALKLPQQVLFLDKGAADGVARGDMFELRREPTRNDDGTITVDEVMATVQVVRVGERTATGLIVSVVSPTIRQGTRAVQVAKLP